MTTDMPEDMMRDSSKASCAESHRTLKQYKRAGLALGIAMLNRQTLLHQCINLLGHLHLNTTLHPTRSGPGPYRPGTWTTPHPQLRAPVTREPSTTVEIKCALFGFTSKQPHQYILLPKHLCTLPSGSSRKFGKGRQSSNSLGVATWLHQPSCDRLNPNHNID